MPEQEKHIPEADLREMREYNWLDKQTGYKHRLLDALIDAYAESHTQASVIENLRREAESWAQEARAQRSTVHECYKAAGTQAGDLWAGLYLCRIGSTPGSADSNIREGAVGNENCGKWIWK